MNERIRELAEQATRKYDRLGNDIPFAQPDLELFAELIVRECVAKTMEVGEQNDEPIEPIWVANCIAHRIFKHFGVTE